MRRSNKVVIKTNQENIKEKCCWCCKWYIERQEEVENYFRYTTLNICDLYKIPLEEYFYFNDQPVDPRATTCNNFKPFWELKEEEEK